MRAREVSLVFVCMSLEAHMGRAADEEEQDDMGEAEVAGDHPRHVCSRGKTKKVL